MFQLISAMASRKIGRKGVFNLRQRTPGIHDKGSLLGSANHENEAPRPKTESRDEMSKYGKCSDCTIRPKAPFTSNVQLISAPMALALKTKPRRRREHGPLQPTSLANGPGKIRGCRSSIPPLPICTTNRPNLRKPRRKIICAIAQALVGFALRASVASCLRALGCGRSPRCINLRPSAVDSPGFRGTLGTSIYAAIGGRSHPWPSPICGPFAAVCSKRERKNCGVD